MPDPARARDGAARVPTARAAHPQRRGRRGATRAIAELDGTADSGFGPVADAFGRSFETLGEIGAAVAVRHRGRLVVDLDAGTDPICDRPFTRETLMMVASCTNRATATAVLMLAEAGAIDLDEPIRIRRRGA